MYDGDNESFGKRLRNLRESKGLSQSDFAEILGYKHHASVSNIEANKTPPDLNALVKIADAFQVDLHWLITGEIYNPAKRLESHLSKVSKQYNDLVMQLEAARQIVDDLESKQARGEQLTPDEEDRLLQNKGRIRSLPRMMENYIKHQAEILKAMQIPPENPL